MRKLRTYQKDVGTASTEISRICNEHKDDVHVVEGTCMHPMIHRASLAVNALELKRVKKEKVRV